MSSSAISTAHGHGFTKLKEVGSGGLRQGMRPGCRWDVYVVTAVAMEGKGSEVLYTIEGEADACLKRATLGPDFAQFM